MNSKRLNPNTQDYHAISSLIQHYNPHQKKSSVSDDYLIPEPEACPRPHTSISNVNQLSVPISNPIDTSFRSLSSRADLTNRSKRSGDFTKRSAAITKRNSSPYASPKTVAQEVERIILVEQQIKIEKEKYKKLEKKYKDMMTTQNQNQNRFEAMVQELKKKIEEKQGAHTSVGTVTQDINMIHQQLKNLEQKLDTFLDYFNTRA